MVVTIPFLAKFDDLLYLADGKGQSLVGRISKIAAGLAGNHWVVSSLQAQIFLSKLLEN
jgi:hypothetical protein